jgi:hypothetical protein
VTAGISVGTTPTRYGGIAVLAGTCALATIVLLAGTVLGRLSVGSAVAALPPSVLVLAATVAAYRRRRSAERPETTVTVRRFQVQTGTGDLVPCVVHGDVVGGELRPGDIVRIGGRWAAMDRRWLSRLSPRVVRHLTLLYTPTGPEISRLSVRLPARVLASRRASRLCVAIAVLVVLWTGYVVAHG